MREIEGHLYIVLAFQSLAVMIVQDVSSVASDYVFAKRGKEQFEVGKIMFGLCLSQVGGHGGVSFIMRFWP